MHLTIRQRILGSYALIMAIMLIMGGIVYAHLRAVTREATNVEEFSMPALYYVTQMLNAFNEDYVITQEFGLDPNPSTIASLAREVQESRSKMLSFAKKYVATITDADERGQYEEYENHRIPYLRIQDDVLKLAADPKNGRRIATMVREDLDPEYDKIRTLLGELVDRNKGEADTSAKLIVASVASATQAILMSFGIALLLSIACIYYLLRSITRPLDGLVTAMGRMRQGDFTQRIDRQDEFGALGQAFNGMADDLASLFGEVQKSGIRVTSSVTEIAATAKEQQTTANEIAVTTTEIGATSREISATSRELVKTMRDVSLVGEQTAALAGDGQTGLARMEETMRRVVDAASSINAKLGVLNEKAGNINQMVITITKVADQTNLLSLNAAIEAEKAGEYGRGFAVVASEIRRLADQTAVATYDIEQMVKEIHSAVSAGVMGMDKFSEEVRRGMAELGQVSGQLTQIIHQVQALAPRFDAVNEGMQAQATGAEQISEALTQLGQAARQTVESQAQSSRAIEDLNQVSSGLRSGVSRFKLVA
ncbi:MAG: methyl-accepting chemotaxis protein WspA [Gammaproteobacteria bacterium]|jgi:methyl-accepting chemotaxis protein WspA|nr:methyl-accepting chemotaxis protein WspA [Gammaproteobacteria bacterium]